MQVFERNGLFLPSKLQHELAAAGVPVLGVTATEDDSGNVTAVQIICEDGAGQTDVDAVVSAHDPTPDPQPAPSPTPQQVAGQMADTINQAVAAVPDTANVAQLRDAITSALSPYLPPTA